MKLITGEAVEQLSMETIDREAGEHAFDALHWPVVRRMIHATADFSVMDLVNFHNNPIESAMAALRQGAPIITDSNMLKSGLSRARLRKINPLYEEDRIFCNVADEHVAKEAKDAGIPRSVFNIRSLKYKVNGGIVCVGNAPTALWETVRLIQEEHMMPAVVLAMPVGFVNVTESKDLIKETDAPAVIIEGRRGGTTFAVSALNAIMILALETK